MATLLVQLVLDKLDLLKHLSYLRLASVLILVGVSSDGEGYLGEALVDLLLQLGLSLLADISFLVEREGDVIGKRFEVFFLLVVESLCSEDACTSRSDFWLNA